MDASRYRSLSARQRALVAVAVLLDGREAGMYLENDLVHGVGLRKASLELAEMEPELRMPLVGTLLRSALYELARGKMDKP